MVKHTREHPHQSKTLNNRGDLARVKVKNLCRFCLRKKQKLHLCAGQYTYEFILEPFFKGIALDANPLCCLDLYEECKTVIEQEQLFAECANIHSIIYKNLKYYIQDYEL